MAADTLRRLLDLVASLAGLTLLSPLFVFIALLIALDSPGPVFYRGQRVGRHGRLFRLYKFRSMVISADKQGPGITAAGDARITRVGRFLRRAKLDELPQLINVLLGDMSLVGPRPEDPRYVAFYTPEQRRVLSVRPGITSPRLPGLPSRGTVARRRGLGDPLPHPRPPRQTGPRPGP